MRVALDFDGVLARRVAVPRLLARFRRVAKWLLLFAPEVPGLERLREAVRSGRAEVRVVTSRPPDCAAVTRLWLRLHRVPAAGVVCAGSDEEKVEAALSWGADVLVDDKSRCVDMARRSGLAAELFSSWEALVSQSGLWKNGAAQGGGSPR